MMKRFRSLTLGVRRSLMIGTIPGSMLVGGILGSLSEPRLDGDDFLLYSLFWGIPIYWVIVFIGLWIYEGFKTS
jgi:hypothetical protein